MSAHFISSHFIPKKKDDLSKTKQDWRKQFLEIMQKVFRLQNVNSFLKVF